MLCYRPWLTIGQRPCHTQREERGEGERGEGERGEGERGEGERGKGERGKGERGEGEREVFQHYMNSTVSKVMPDFDRNPWCNSMRIYWLRGDDDNPKERERQYSDGEIE